MYVDHDCRKKSQCSEGSLIECSDLLCDEFARCGVQGGARDCYCKDGYVGDGLECEQGSPCKHSKGTFASKMMDVKMMLI